jgi:hypothetical protein
VIWPKYYDVIWLSGFHRDLGQEQAENQFFALPSG